MEQHFDPQKAKQVFSTVCDMITHQNWSHEKDEEKLQAEILLRGGGEPIHLFITVNPQVPVITVKADVGLQIEEERREDVAIALCCINEQVIRGLFDYDMDSAKVIFRITNGYLDIEISEKTIYEMLVYAVATVDDSYEKLARFNRGEISVEELIRQVND